MDFMTDLKMVLPCNLLLENALFQMASGCKFFCIKEIPKKAIFILRLHCLAPTPFFEVEEWQIKFSVVNKGSPVFWIENQMNKALRSGETKIFIEGIDLI